MYYMYCIVRVGHQREVEHFVCVGAPDCCFVIVAIVVVVVLRGGSYPPPLLPHKPDSLVFFFHVPKVLVAGG